MSTNEYRVSGMTCGHCEMSIREEVSEVAGVDAVDVSAETGMLRVSGGAVDAAAVLAAVTAAGYHAVALG